MGNPTVNRDNQQGVQPQVPIVLNNGGRQQPGPPIVLMGPPQPQQQGQVNVNNVIPGDAQQPPPVRRKADEDPAEKAEKQDEQPAAQPVKTPWYRDPSKLTKIGIDIAEDVGISVAAMMAISALGPLGWVVGIVGGGLFKGLTKCLREGFSWKNFGKGLVEGAAVGLLAPLSMGVGAAISKRIGGKFLSRFLGYAAEGALFGGGHGAAKSSAKQFIGGDPNKSFGDKLLYIAKDTGKGILVGAAVGGFLGTLSGAANKINPEGKFAKFTELHAPEKGFLKGHDHAHGAHHGGEHAAKHAPKVKEAVLHPELVETSANPVIRQLWSQITDPAAKEAIRRRLSTEGAAFTEKQVIAMLRTQVECGTFRSGQKQMDNLVAQALQRGRSADTHPLLHAVGEAAGHTAPSAFTFLGPTARGAIKEACIDGAGKTGKNALKEELSDDEKKEKKADDKKKAEAAREDDRREARLEEEHQAEDQRLEQQRLDDRRAQLRRQQERQTAVL